jgi:hypothetical protein
MCARFRIKNLGQIRQNIERWKNATEQQMTRSLAEWADDLVAAIGREILSLQIIDQGILYAATTRSEVQRIGTKLRVVVFNPTEYAVVIEFGRRPKQGAPPPLLPIVGWASRKGIVQLPRNISFGGEWQKKWAASGAILRNIKKGKKAGRPQKKREMDPEVRDLLIVRLIAQKIYEKGFQGRHPFSIAFDRKAQTFVSDIAGMLSR